MCQKIRVWIRRNFPPMAKHLVDLPDVLNQGLWQKALKYELFQNGNEKGSKVLKEYKINVWAVIDEDGFTSTIFAQPDLLAKCSLATIFTIDGTFKRAPQLQGVYQLLTFMVEVYNKLIYYFSFNYRLCIYCIYIGS